MTDVHDEIENWMATAIAGGLTPEEQQAFEKHLAGCPDCEKLFKEEKMMSLMLEEAFTPERPPRDFEDRMVRKFRRDVVRQENFWSVIYQRIARLCRIRYVQWGTVAATLMIMGGLLSPSLQRARESARQSNVHLPQSGKTDGGNIFHEGGQAEWEREQALVSAADSRSSASTQLKKNLKQTAAISEEKLKDIEKAGSRMDAFATVNKTGSQKLSSAPVNVGGMAGKELGPVSDRARGLISGQAAASGEVVNFLSAEEPAKMLEDAQSHSGKLRENEFAATKKPKTQAGAEEMDMLDGKAAMRKIQERSESSPSPAAVPEVRKLIRNASLQFEVQNFEASLEQIIKIVKEENGFVATTNSARLPNGKVSGQVIIKVLPDHLDRLLLKFRALGDLKNQSLATDDVTKAYFDTEARVRNAKRMEERLLKMLDEAKGKVTDLLVVEKELARVREQIEQMQGELKLWDALVQFATITINLHEKDMNQPAAFLLKEKANLSIFSPDVEKVFREAKRAAESAKAQVLHSNLNRDNTGRVSAVLSVLADPEQSGELLGRFKGMGRVNSLTWQNERVAQGGTGVSETARVQKDKVEINLAIVHDDESRKQVNMVLVTKTVEEALEKTKTAATDGVKILASSLEQRPDGKATARFAARVPAKVYPTFLTALKALGRVSEFTIQRDDKAVQNKEADDAPVLFSLVLTDEETPQQQSNLTIEAKEVEGKISGIKESAAGFGAEIRNSTFERTPDGRELANFTFRLPMSKHAPFVDYLKNLGKARDFSVRRQDRPREGKTIEDAPAEVTLLFYSQSNIVTDETGLFATLRRTLMQGLEALMWSVRMIGVALAFLAPWALVVGLPAWLVLRIRRRRMATAMGTSKIS